MIFDRGTEPPPLSVTYVPASRIELTTATTFTGVNPRFTPKA